MKLSEAIEIYIQRKQDAGMRLKLPGTYCTRFSADVATSIFNMSQASKSQRS